MKFSALFLATLVFGLTLVASDAEAARRLGSGRSSGMQREAVVPQKASPATPAPTQGASAAQPHAPAAAPQAQPKRSWLGPVAGLAAGLGLAALASHLGFGQELASMLLIGLLLMVVLAVVGYIMKRRAAAQHPQLATAGGPSDFRVEPQASAFTPVAAGGGASPASPTGRIPADFDVDSFVRSAKVNFIRLQAANDAGNLADLREFTTPEMFAELKMDLAERGADKHETDVVAIDAQVLDVAEEADRYVVSVRFNGQIRESGQAQTEPFDEVWHMTKPRDGSHGWVLAGIQQVI